MLLLTILVAIYGVSGLVQLDSVSGRLHLDLVLRGAEKSFSSRFSMGKQVAYQTPLLGIYVLPERVAGIAIRYPRCELWRF
jgi:hypothetical protein